MAKTIDLSSAKQRQLEGIKKSVEIMALTIGPRGANVCLTNGDIVNDGKRIAEDVVLKDPIENKGAMRVRRLVRRISSDVGGGRTACAILFKELCQTGLNLLERGFNGNLIRKGMELAVKDITAELDKMAKPAKGHLKEIATISTESEELGQVIAEVMEKVGVDSDVKVEESQSFGVSYEREDGLKYDKGYISPYMVTKEKSLEAEYEDISVCIIDKKISSFGDLVPILERVAKGGKKDLFVIAEDIDESVLRLCALHKMNGMFNLLATKSPGIGDMKKFCLEDIGQLVHATVLTEQNWESSFETETVKTPKGEVPVKLLKANLLGKAKKITCKQHSTIITSNKDIKTWITTLKTRKELAENKWEIDQFNERIAKLTNGIAVIKVGASSEDEVKYLKLKIEDGVNETKIALEEGIVMGGNVAFIHAVDNSLVPVGNLDEKELGYIIVANAIQAPFRQIVQNSNGSPDVVVDKIRESKDLTRGYNSLDNTVVENMYKLGIIDAVKVVKTVLQYAVSEAGIFLSIGGDISEEVIETK